MPSQAQDFGGQELAVAKGWRWFLGARLVLTESLATIAPGNMWLALLSSRWSSHHGDRQRTQRAARRILDTFSRSPDLLARHLAKATSKRRTSRGIAPEQARDALADLLGCVAEADEKPFLVFGTLLGAVRDHGFIRGDGDVDLGIIGGKELRDLRNRCQAKLGVSQIKWVGNRASKFGARHRNGVKIDVKAFEPEADGSLTWHAHFGNIVLRKRYPRQFGLKWFSFLGTEVRVPDQPEEFLEWQYGPGWITPDPGYHMHTSGPLHGTEHTNFVSTIGPAAILKMLRSGRGAKALAMTRSIAVLFPDDELWPRFTGALETVLASSSPISEEASDQLGRSL